MDQWTATVSFKGKAAGGGLHNSTSQRSCLCEYKPHQKKQKNVSSSHCFNLGTGPLGVPYKTRQANISAIKKKKKSTVQRL